MTTQGKWLKVIDRATIVVALLMSLYHMVATQYLMHNAIRHQDVHLGFSLTLVFLATLRTMKGKGLWFLVLALLIGSITATTYVYVRYSHLEMNIGFPDTLDTIIGIMLLIVVLEGTRESWGPILPIIAISFSLYMFFGNYAPPFIRLPMGYQPEYVVSALGIGFSGALGDFMSISANYIFLFVLFGGVLQACGALGFILEVGKIAGRVLAGGPAHTAVIGSSLVGTVSGAAVANVALTGAFTIPLMKKVGYHRDMAGAVEATASSGGQIMPPVMGAAAFLMANLLGVTYTEIMIAAIIPALLYYYSCGLGVQVFALREKIAAPKVAVDRKALLGGSLTFVIPLGTLIVLLLLRYSPSYAAFYAILGTVGLSFLTKQSRPTLGGLARGFTDGAVAGAKIAVAISTIGIMAQVTLDTVLGVRFASLVEILAGDRVVIALVLTMIVSVILGCGVPTTGAYILVAIMIVPALTRMGIYPMGAHFFAFYFATISSLTPPVAIASLAGASIAGGNYWKTSINAVRLALAGFIVPFYLVFNPVFLLQPGQPSLLSGVTTIISAVLSTTVMTALVYNYLFTPFTKWEWAGYALCAVLNVLFIFTTAQYYLFVAGTALFILLMIPQWKRRSRMREIKQVTTASTASP